MTPHVHWHVIPRYADDLHFPSPIWAEARRAGDPALLAQRQALLPALRSAIVRRLEALG
jgi:diadenosine tetraphosphate (Ap4A) HIT family hydrolase